MKAFTKYGITTLIGLIFTFIICLTKKIFSQKAAEDVFHILTDAFFAPGVCILGFGVLVFASNNGTFDMINYGLRKFFGFFKKDISQDLHHTFADYRLAKADKRSPFGYLIIVGFCFIAISLMFLAFWYKFKN